MALATRVLRRVNKISFLRVLSEEGFCTSSSSSSWNPVLMRLLQVPSSQVKPTLDVSDHALALKSSEFSWDALVSGLMSSSPEKARLALEWRLERMINDNEIDHEQCSSIIFLCTKIRNVSLAMRVLTSMEARHIRPTTSLFNAVIHVCLSSNNVITALGLFDTMEDSEGYKPDSETYDLFVLGFSNLGDAHNMFAWFAAKKAAGFSANQQNYEAVIFGCVKRKDFDSVCKFYEEMLASGIITSLPVFQNVLKGLCKWRNGDRVVEFLKFLLECGFEITGDMIEEVATLCSGLRRVDKMEELLVTLMEFNQGGEALLRMHYGIIRLYAMLDRLDDVEYSVGRMLNQGISFRSPIDVENVISSYLRLEAFDRLDLFLEHIKAYYKLTRSTYNLLVAGYQQAGLSEKVVLMLKDMEFACL